ncbi:MAG: hypothetical protein QME92_10910 [Bacillota bacterium]|nr:hypothetical protein [Bacillota bacterium]
MQCSRVQEILDDYIFTRGARVRGALVPAPRLMPTSVSRSGSRSRSQRGPAPRPAPEPGLKPDQEWVRRRDGGECGPEKAAMTLGREVPGGEATSEPAAPAEGSTAPFLRGATGAPEIPDDLPGGVREHVAACPRCRRALREMTVLAAALGRGRAEPEMPPALGADQLAERVMTAIRAGKVPHPAPSVYLAGEARLAPAARVQPGWHRGSLLRDMLVLAGLAAAAVPVVLATSVMVVFQMLDARAALATPLRIAGLLLRPAAVAVNTLADLALDGLVGIIRFWSLVSSVLFDVGGGPMLALLAFTLGMGLLLVTLLARSGWEEARPVG